MTRETILPSAPKTPYVKPTWATTHGGKGYRPTHPGIARVEFSKPDGSSVQPAAESFEETFASRLIAGAVSFHLLR